MSELTDKQKRFVQEYLIDLNATQSAIRAGYAEKTANREGSRLLSNVDIADAIAEAQKERAERTGVTADRVLKELARIGFSDLRNCLSPGGNLIDPQDWDDDTAAAISSVEVVKTHGSNAGNSDEDRPIEYTHKIKVWDKNSALEKIGKHLGMFVERREVSGSLAVVNLTSDDADL